MVREERLIRNDDEGYEIHTSFWTSHPGLHLHSWYSRPTLKRWCESNPSTLVSMFQWYCMCWQSDDDISLRKPILGSGFIHWLLEKTKSSRFFRDSFSFQHIFCSSTFCSSLYEPSSFLLLVSIWKSSWACHSLSITNSYTKHFMMMQIVRLHSSDRHTKHISGLKFRCLHASDADYFGN